MSRLLAERATPIGAWALIITAVAAAGCDTVPLMAPSNSTITVTASTNVVAAGGTADVSAFVAESGGTPVQNGTMVRFTTNLGRMDPVEVQTRNGLATTTFHAGDASGVADVRATSGSAGGGTSGGNTAATNVVQITVGAAAVDSVTLRANPGTFPPTGGTVELIASVIGTGGRTLSNVPVSFTTSAGSLASIRVLSDAAGEARTQLTTTQDADVTATAGTKTSSVVKVLRQPTPPTQTVTLAAVSETAVLGVGQRWNFTATLSNSGTGSDPSLAAVRFDWDFGDGVTASTSGNLTSHVYTTANQRRIATVRVTLVNGNTVSATTELIVGAF